MTVAHVPAEYLAEFRIDVEGFIAFEVVEGCVGDYHEMLPASGVSYRAFVDPSGGSENAMTLAISHKRGDQIVIDAVRERIPPFSPFDVVDEFSELLKNYRITKVVGDHRSRSASMASHTKSRSRSNPTCSATCCHC